MLANLNDVLKIAEARGIALGAFNTPNFESIQAVLSAAEELNEPVVIMHAQIHERIGLCTVEEIGKIMLYMADKSTVPVCVHLDHGEDFDYVQRALKTGYTSVMYDGSELSGEENIANTSFVVSMAQKYGASVEAEIGSMGERDGGGLKNDSIYTDPEDAKNFALKTGIDALTCAFGTVHGAYLTEPKLDFERVSRLKDTLTVPIVMHGGSGISEADLNEVIERGVRKINYYTYLAKAGGDVISNKKYTLFHEAVTDATKAMKEDVLNAMRIYSRLK